MIHKVEKNSDTRVLVMPEPYHYAQLTMMMNNKKTMSVV